MPRKLRIQHPGAMRHVMSRGNRREDIFPGDMDRQDFLKTLAEGCQKTGWQVHAYCDRRGSPLGYVQEREHPPAPGDEAGRALAASTGQPRIMNGNAPGYGRPLFC